MNKLLSDGLVDFNLNQSKLEIIKNNQVKISFEVNQDYLKKFNQRLKILSQNLQENNLELMIFNQNSPFIQGRQVDLSQSEVCFFEKSDLEQISGRLTELGY